MPPNVEFVIDDAEEPWAFPEKFDFVHSRQMVGSFASWPEFLKLAYEYVHYLYSFAAVPLQAINILLEEQSLVGGLSSRTLAYLPVTTKTSPGQGLINGTVQLYELLM